MRIIATTDFLGKSEFLEPLRQTVGKMEPDVFLFLGGMSRGELHIKVFEESLRTGQKPSKTEDALREERKMKSEDIVLFLEFLKSLNTPCLIIPGRTDSPVPMYEKLIADNVGYPDLHFVHLKYLQIGRFLFSGCGGLVADESEEYFEHRINSDVVVDSMKNLRSFGQDKILLFHTPFETTGENGTLSGTSCVKEIIEYLKPKLFFYGMTSPEKKMTVIGESVTVNPGLLARGEYAVVNTKTMNVEFKTLEVD